MHPFKVLLLSSVVTASITSCVVLAPPGLPAPTSVSASFGTYDVLPDTYVGDAYVYRNRYYYGGNYEHGRFLDHGRQYSGRYSHGGQYYYGGNQRHYEGRAQQQQRAYGPGGIRRGQIRH